MSRFHDDVTSLYCIKNEIHAFLAFERRSDWYIGVTDDLVVRETHHNDPVTWHAWKPSNETISREIKRHFIDFDVDGNPDDLGDATYLYIFKKPE